MVGNKLGLSIEIGSIVYDIFDLEVTEWVDFRMISVLVQVILVYFSVSWLVFG